MDRAAFFAAVRPMFGTLKHPQVVGMGAILDEAEKRKTPLQFLAYMLATARHETAGTMQPIAEYGKGKGRAYGKPINGHAYYGRGFVQLTWLSNYEKASTKLGVDLVGEPGLALNPEYAAEIMFQGMEEGWFTDKKLSDYIGQHGADYRNARRIINGVDKAEAIAGYARSFERALKLAGY